MQEAEELCRLILREQPNLAIGQAALGRAFYEAGKLDEALTCLERTIGQTPGCFAAYRWLAEVLVQKGAWDQAHAVLAQAAVLAPDNARVRQLLRTLPHPAMDPMGRGPNGADPARGAYMDMLAAEIEMPVPPRPRTEEYPPDVFNDIAARIPGLPTGAIPLSALRQQSSSTRHDDIPTRAELPNLRGPGLWQLFAWFQRRFSGGRRRQGPGWRGFATALGVGLAGAAAIGVAFWAMSGPSATLPPLPPRPVSHPEIAPVAERPSATPGTVPVKSPPAPPVAPTPKIVKTTPVAEPARPAPPAISPGPGSTSAIGTQAMRDTLERALATGERKEIEEATRAAAPLVGTQEVAAAMLFGAALLAVDYGAPVTPQTRALLESLRAARPKNRVASDIEAARVLLALRAGDLAGARATSHERMLPTPWLAFADTKVRLLSGAGDVSKAPVAEVAGHPFGPGVLLRAEALMDEGDPAAAAELLSALVKRVPGHARALLMLNEAKTTMALQPSAEETAALRSACTANGPESPVVQAECQLDSTAELRRTADRAVARARAVGLARAVPPDARLLARTAQLLLNLGETKRADELVTRARALAAPTYPPLVWATLGVALNRGRVVATDYAHLPADPETRLIAARMALAHDGAAGVARALQGVTASQLATDPDLSWFALLPRIQHRKVATRTADKYLAPARQPRGPVAPYVLGLLARWGGRRHLAAFWLSRAREGHGDACSAAALYAAVLTDLGRTPSAETIPSECKP